MSSNLLLSAIVIAVIALLSSGLYRFESALRTLDAERLRVEQVRVETTELVALRQRRATAQLNEPPEEDLLHRVRGSMVRAGLPHSRFSGLSTNADEAIRSSPGHRRKSYRLELNGLDPTDLASFLEDWRSREPLWSIDNIELRVETPGRAGSTGRSGSPTSPGTYTVTIRMSTVYAGALPARTP